MPAREGKVRRSVAGYRPDMTAFRPRCDISDSKESEDRAEPTDPAEPTDRTEPTEPMLPMDSAEPTLPIERTEPFDPMDSSEFSDQSDQRDTGRVEAAMPT